MPLPKLTINHSELTRHCETNNIAFAPVIATGERLLANFRLVSDGPVIVDPTVAGSGEMPMQAVAGITGMDLDGRNVTRVTLAKYSNTKDRDAFNEYTSQTYAGNGTSMLILPVHQSSAIKAALEKVLMAAVAEKPVEFGPNGVQVSILNLNDFDKLLKNIASTYTGLDLTPDVYNSDFAGQVLTPQADGRPKQIIVKSLAAGVHVAEKFAPVEVVIVNGPANQPAFFQGNGNVGLAQDEQAVNFPFVVVRQGKEQRALEMGYAIETLRDEQGGQLNWDTIPRVNTADLHSDIRLFLEAGVTNSSVLQSESTALKK